MVREGQARLVNELGESFTVTQVANGYKFELVIPSAKNALFSTGGGVNVRQLLKN